MTLNPGVANHLRSQCATLFIHGKTMGKRSIIAYVEQYIPAEYDDDDDDKDDETLLRCLKKPPSLG